MAYLQSYVGPYMKIKRKTETITKEYKSCINNICKNFNKRFSLMSGEKFCSECGSEIKILSEPDVKILQFWDNPLNNGELIDIDKNNYIIRDYHIVVPNLFSLRPDKSLLSYGEHSDGAISIKYLEQEFLKIQNDIEELKEKCKTQILVLEKFYGKKNISYHWGIFQYYD